MLQGPRVTLHRSTCCCTICFRADAGTARSSAHNHTFQTYAFGSLVFVADTACNARQVDRLGIQKHTSRQLFQGT